MLVYPHIIFQVVSFGYPLGLSYTFVPPYTAASVCFGVFVVSVCAALPFASVSSMWTRIT